MGLPRQINARRGGIPRRAACRAACLLLVAACFALAWSLPSNLLAADKPMTVACVGDSITMGSRIEDRTMTYPAQLERLLGNGWRVVNYGVSGATMLTNGNKPYVRQKEYNAALDAKADIVVIMLGTNDSKPRNWAHKEEFTADAKALIESFRATNPSGSIFLCLPVPAFAVNYEIHGDVISGEIIPLLRQVAKDEGVPLIDCFAALSGKGDLFPDHIHPNADGAGLIAAAVRGAVAK
jgi:acyl-CoA thioesterase-1